MKLTYDDKTNSGFINEYIITTKPKFSFSYAWIFVNEEVAYKLIAYGGNSQNEELSEDERKEVVDFVTAYTPPQPIVEELSEEEIKKQKQREFIVALDDFIQTQINTYNERKLTVFEDIKAVSLYASFPKVRTHTPFCKWLWEYKDDIYDYAGAELQKIQQGQREYPLSTAALIEEISAKYPLKTNSFIGS